MNRIENYFDAAQLNFIDGIFWSKEKQKISYPEDGNETCFQVEENSYWFQHRNRVIHYFIKKYNRNFLLDIGGGNGCVSLFLTKMGLDCVLLEPGTEGAINAKKKGLNNVVCSTLEKSEILSGHTPAAGLFDVLEHIENTKEFLGRINSSLTSEGLIFLTVPAFQLLWSEEDVRAGHFKRYTISSVRKELIEAGFEIIDHNYFFSMLPIPIFFFRKMAGSFGKRFKENKKIEKQEHGANGGLIIRMLKIILKFELFLIKKGVRLKVGSSLFVVAKKRNEQHLVQPF